MTEENKSFGKKIGDFFSKHPHSIGETYGQHFAFAFYSGFRMVFGGLACILHSIFPFIFIDTASETVKNLSNDFAERRNKRKSPIKD